MPPGLRRHLVVEELAAGLTAWSLDGILAALRDESHVTVLGGGFVEGSGDWTFVCLDPVAEISARHGTVRTGPPGALVPRPGRPFEVLREVLASWRTCETEAPDHGVPPFTGGAVGHLGYGLLHEIERVPDTGRDDLGLQDLSLTVHDALLAFDHRRGRALAVANGFGTTTRDARHAAGARITSVRAWARRMLDAGSRWVGSPPGWPAPSGNDPPGCGHRLSLRDLDALGVVPVVDRGAYLDAISVCHDHIAAGNAYEICLTHRFDTTFHGRGDELFADLVAVAPAPMSAYLRRGDTEVMSASPERFLRLGPDRWAETRPIKGTRPRGRSPTEDRALAADLAFSAKDRAENVMIVDLARNDLGRVCEFGTVRVPDLCVVESHPHTHQLVSTVRGRLRPEADAVDLVTAAFPGGSMTGAPKIAAMAIIDDLEPVTRGAFAGSIGWFGYDGSLDLSIVIRTFVRRGGLLTFNVGGAIVADSDADEEYQETLDKARGLAMALARNRSRSSTAAAPGRHPHSSERVSASATARRPAMARGTRRAGR